MIRAKNVGVAPGTTTLQFKGVGFGSPAARTWLDPGDIQAPDTCAPDGPGWYSYADVDPKNWYPPVPYPNGFQGPRYYDPYSDFVKLKGLRGLRAIDTTAHIRWDIIGLVGGGALVIAMAAGLIANAFNR